MVVNNPPDHLLSPDGNRTKGAWFIVFGRSGSYDKLWKICADAKKKLILQGKKPCGDQLFSKTRIAS
ncbi:hypothetical protein B2K_29085 [Paenibacillus mucilaginosus K02]|uniref:Uncharacterized protein n=1 Tax=Paenibacillus mucilaginosus K02 TaxID=997761 RepID=I0BQQ8_9BACL|nr:hypothetical protein B2K_29085 [Paenibacillus mucilaginosus K02]